MLKHTRFIIGNSSAGVREAPVYGVRTINVGTRQHGRFESSSVTNTPYETEAIVETISYPTKMLMAGFAGPRALVALILSLGAALTNIAILALY